MESKVVTSSSPSNFQLGEKVLTSNTTKILYHMGPASLYGLYFTIFVVSPMVSGFRYCCDTLSRDLRQQLKIWSVSAMFRPSEPPTRPNRHQNASYPRHIWNAKHARSEIPERAVAPRHLHNIVDSAWTNPEDQNGISDLATSNGWIMHPGWSKGSLVSLSLIQ